MKLGVGDRVVLISLLPREGDLTTIRIVHELRQSLSFTEEEHKELQIKAEGDTLTWETEGEETKEISIGPRAHTLICEELEKMDKESKLTEDYLSLWDKFVVVESDD